MTTLAARAGFYAYVAVCSFLTVVLVAALSLTSFYSPWAGLAAALVAAPALALTWAHIGARWALDTEGE